MNASAPLRARVTAWYVGLLALALLVVFVAVYLGVRAFVTNSLERALIAHAQNIVTDYLGRLKPKGRAGSSARSSESYPPGSAIVSSESSQDGRSSIRRATCAIRLSRRPGLPCRAIPPGSGPFIASDLQDGQRSSCTRCPMHRARVQLVPDRDGGYPRLDQARAFKSRLYPSDHDARHPAGRRCRRIFC